MMDEAEGFKVTDRRRRASAEEDAAVAPPAAGPAPERAAAPPAAEAASSPELEMPADQLDLRAVFMMFASSALLGLGEDADPMTGQRHIDLAEAEQAIDVLLLLREKTEGNRTDDESAFLDDLLYDLQMRFVRITQAPRP